MLMSQELEGKQQRKPIEVIALNIWPSIIINQLKCGIQSNSLCDFNIWTWPKHGHLNFLQTCKCVMWKTTEGLQAMIALAARVKQIFINQNLIFDVSQANSSLISPNTMEDRFDVFNQTTIVCFFSHLRSIATFRT